MSVSDQYPKISVITVSFNQGEFIRKNIESVLAQRYPNFEHIVVDGGSTDDTVAILREYPHLLWTSESDRGQSHGLNKGFSRASGDIIAWLNSDDWYAEDCFQSIVPHLKEYPLLLGAAQETRKDGSPTQIIHNIGRTKYDLLRNWIPYAWLSQTSVFFTRDLLERVKYGPGCYLDESLYFCMDLDLWLRFANLFPFSKRLDKILSYYRVYDSNKTGARAVAGNKECMRTFRRYETIWTAAERKFSFILPLTAPSDDATRTIASIIEQDVQDMEIVLVAYSSDSSVQKRIREYCFDLAEAVNHINFRFEVCSSELLLEAYNVGARAAAAPILCFCQVGDVFDQRYCYEALKIFNRDLAAVAVPALHQPELNKLIFNQQTNGVDPLQLIQSETFPTNLIVRKIAFEEFSGFKFTSIPALSVKLFLLEIAVQGWWINLENELELLPATSSGGETSQQAGLKSLIHARIVLSLEALFTESEFLRFKRDQRLTFSFPAPVFETARATLARAPENWPALPTLTIEELKTLTASYPECFAVWSYLEIAYRNSGDTTQAELASQTARRLSLQFLEL